MPLSHRSFVRSDDLFNGATCTPTYCVHLLLSSIVVNTNERIHCSSLKLCDKSLLVRPSCVLRRNASLILESVSCCFCSSNGVGNGEILVCRQCPLCSNLTCCHCRSRTSSHGASEPRSRRSVHKQAHSEPLQQFTHLLLDLALQRNERFLAPED